VIYFIIYVRSCPSASFFAPLNSTHGVNLCRSFLIPSFPNIVCGTSVCFSDLVSVQPATTVVVCGSCWSLSLSYRFNLDLECRNFAIELCDEIMGRFKLSCKFGIGGNLLPYPDLMPLPSPVAQLLPLLRSSTHLDPVQPSC
jgi:hypothetical protein